MSHCPPRNSFLVYCLLKNRFYFLIPLFKSYWLEGRSNRDTYKHTECHSLQRSGVAGRPGNLLRGQMWPCCVNGMVPVCLWRNQGLQEVSKSRFLSCQDDVTTQFVILLVSPYCMFYPGMTTNSILFLVLEDWDHIFKTIKKVIWLLTNACNVSRLRFFIIILSHQVLTPIKSYYTCSLVNSILFICARAKEWFTHTHVSHCGFDLHFTNNGANFATHCQSIYSRMLTTVSLG